MANDTPDKEKLCSVSQVRYDVNGVETWILLPDAILTVTEEGKERPAVEIPDKLQIL